MLLRCLDRILDLSRPAVMGVLNVTPDSFSDGGRFPTVAAAVDRALQMVEEGAAIIDVGGESTRPGAQPISADEELSRVIPVIERLRASSPILISVDTSKAVVMRAAAAAGAGLINDVRALSADGALDAVVSTGCAVCLVHMQGEPGTMQQAPQYVDVVREVKEFLEAHAQSCRLAGVAADRIVLDPGFGFGKTLAHNLQLLRHLRELGTALPILAGLSRKAIVGSLTGRPPGDRMQGSIALAVMAVINGARIVRVHDVAATVDAMKIVTAVQEDVLPDQGV
jgi:dihydropteroate synthase